MSSTIGNSLLAIVVISAVLAVQFAPETDPPVLETPVVEPQWPVVATGHQPVVASVPIDSCRQVDSPGSYHLATDLVSHSYTCLEVRADDVVLDGRGHTLTVAESARAYGAAIAMPTPGQFGEAVVITGARSNVTVANLSVDGFDTGIRSHGGMDLTFVGVSGTDSVTVIDLDRVSGVRLEATTVRESAGDGLRIRESTDIVVANVTVESSWIAGIVVDGSERVSIGSTTVSQNHGDGLFVHNSTDVRVTGLTASENAVGVLVIAADGTTVTASTVDRNAIAGVVVLAADDVVVAESTIVDTVGDPGVVDIERTAGLLTVDGNVTLRDVVVGGNHDWTIAATDGSSVVAERVRAGSTIVSFITTEGSIDLKPLTDQPCDRSRGAVVELEQQGSSTGGTVRDITVSCVA